MQRAENRKYHIIYKTTCLINGKFYVGLHSTDILEDGYLGSGKRLSYSVHKYGRENHVYEILEYLPSREDLKLREAEIVNEELLGEKLCMNLQLGGGGGWDHLTKDEFMDMHAKTVEARKKRFQEDEDFRNHIKNSCCKNLKWNGQTWDKDIWIGRKHKEESIQKMKDSKIGKGLGETNSQFGTCWIHHSELMQNKKIKKEELDIFVSDGWTKGRKLFN